MLKSRPDESDTLIKDNRKSTLTNHQLAKCYESDIFSDEIIDESFEFSDECYEFQNNVVSLTLDLR